MLRILPFLLAILFACPTWAILGDLNKDGTVDFPDFFIFVDNFGQSGPPEPADTVTVVQVDTTYVELPPDTVTVVQVDTLYVELPGIPEPPPPEEQTDIEVVQESLNVVPSYFGSINICGELINRTDHTVEGVNSRLILRDYSGRIVAVEDNLWDRIDVLAPGDRRPFLFYDVENVISLDDLEWALFDISWERETDRQLSNDLVLVEQTLFVGEVVSGEVRNYSNETIDYGSITFVSKNAEGQVTRIGEKGLNFNEPLEPGAKGVFQTTDGLVFYEGFDPLSHEIYYYITWGPVEDEHLDFTRLDETPYILLER